MVFNSIEFLLYFLPIFFLIYWWTPDKFKNYVLLTGSLVFYAQGEPVYIILLIASVYLNYYIGFYLGNNGVFNRFEYGKEESVTKGRGERKRQILIAAVAVNVAVLAFFKYYEGGAKLPLGISFYTFQIVAYLLDIYRGNVQAEGSLLQFATYITMFTKLISGPITDYKEMKESLSTRKISAESVQDGLKCFTIGLSMKVLLADRLGVLWHEIQVTGFESISTELSWLAALAYSMKIYFDFYGYSLMAIGLGRMLGFELPKNFDHPYMAGSVREFYRRWHITLGKWFSRYVYIPLGGNRKGTQRTICNLLIVWLLTSIWHGNTVNFLIWGMLLWGCIVVERILQEKGRGEYMGVLSHVYLWVVISISWMCFAITDTKQLLVYLGRMTGLTLGANVQSKDWMAAVQDYSGLLIIAILLCTPLPEKIYLKYKNRLPVVLLVAGLFWMCVNRILLEGNNPFVYFRF